MKRFEVGAFVSLAPDHEWSVEGNLRVTVPVSKRSGSHDLRQEIRRYSPGASPLTTRPASEEVLYVTSGTGACWIDGFRYTLRPGFGVFVPPKSICSIENDGAGELSLVSVCCPDEAPQIVQSQPSPHDDPGATKPIRVVDESQQAEIATGDRKFKMMVDHRVGCHQVTQFIGFIPPSKAPLHLHTYEEAISIIEGSGILWIEDESAEFGPGSSIYLPPRARHCLENPGTEPIRLLGVFYPSGSPAVRYGEERDA